MLAKRGWFTMTDAPDTREAHVRWEPQEEGVMRTTASFPSVRNQGFAPYERLIFFLVNGSDHYQWKRTDIY
jgi:hypothetical protein